MPEPLANKQQTATAGRAGTRVKSEVEIRFDGRRARTYEPSMVAKRARIMRARKGERTTIRAQWGEDQHFVGTWVAVFDDAGELIYGSAYAEWMDMNERVPGTRDLWRKTATVNAYQHRGVRGRLSTVLADGTRETTNVVKPGDWIVKQRNGEVQAMEDADFRRRYDADHPRRKTVRATA